MILCLLTVAFVASFRVDDAVEQSMRDGQNRTVRLWAKRISRWGDWPVLAAVGTVTLGVAAWRRERRVTRLVSIMVLSSTMAGLTANAVRVTAGRARPDADHPAGWYGPWREGKWVAGQRDFSSFPSAHTTVALAFFTPLLCAAAQRSGIVLTGQCLALLAAVSIGWARVYLSVHHLSDVVGGAVLGTIVAMLVAGTRPGWHLRQRMVRAMTHPFRRSRCAEAIPPTPISPALLPSPFALPEIEWMGSARSNQPTRTELPSESDGGKRARFVTDAPPYVIGQN